MQSGEQVMIDGGTGTEVERRGVPQLENAWNGGGALSHPDNVGETRDGGPAMVRGASATLNLPGGKGEFIRMERRDIAMRMSRAIAPIGSMRRRKRLL